MIPLALWLVLGVVYGVIPAIAQGHGNPVAILGLWALYLPAPLALTLVIGVAAGRLAARRRPSITE